MSYQEHIQKIAGKKTKDILLFSLSACVWCEKAEELLDKLGLEYGRVVVDLLDEPADQNEVYKEIGKHSGNIGFPVIIVDKGKKAIIGFNEEEIRAKTR
jgi:glutaredoxin